MKDIAAILVNYSNQAELYKAILSLRKLESRVKKIIVFQKQGVVVRENQLHEWENFVEFIDTKEDDMGELLNHTIDKLDTQYVLFLRDTDYLSPTIGVEHFRLPNHKAVLATTSYDRDIVIHRPLLVRTSLLKQKKFLSASYLPFEEALFPIWLAGVATACQFINEDLVKQSRKMMDINTMEKKKAIQKYQLEIVKTKAPTVSILISNYNMDKYVETAIASCLLQNEKCDQLLIIDDGSTDKSIQKMERFMERERVQVFRKKNEGKAKALNELLSHVTSDFILELDADDWLDFDAISVIKKQVIDLPKAVSVLYGNLKKWKQVKEEVLYKEIAKGYAVSGTIDLLSYRFPLGPRIYRSSTLKEIGGFPVIDYENGRLYEDVSVLNRLIKQSSFCYRDFTVYNVREHNESITKNNHIKWNDFIKTIMQEK